jgi:hypothetical protein
MEAAATAMEGSAAVKAAPTAMSAAPTPAVLGKCRTGARNRQGCQCTNYKPTQFSSCHDRSPSFL